MQAQRRSELDQSSWTKARSAVTPITMWKVRRGWRCPSDKLPRSGFVQHHFVIINEASVGGACAASLLIGTQLRRRSAGQPVDLLPFREGRRRGRTTGGALNHWCTGSLPSAIRSIAERLNLYRGSSPTGTPISHPGKSPCLTLRVRRRRAPGLDPRHAPDLQLGDDLVGDLGIEVGPVVPGASLPAVSGHHGSPRRAFRVFPSASNPSR